MIGQTAMDITEAPQEYAFSDRDFAVIAEMANRKYGLSLQTSKKALVYARLSKRLRSLNLESFKEYCDLLETHPDHEEQSHLLSALTTNVTHFFREQHHFDSLRQQIMPVLAEKAKKGEAVRLWSSACSAGQEAYGIAAMILAAMPDAHSFDIKVLATDVDPGIIEKAKEGCYPNEQLDAVPNDFKALMVESQAAQPGYFSMREELRALLSFGQLNLMDEWPMKRKFDVIFCRNAAIYFDKQTQARLWERFSDIISPSGHLMIGHSERLSGTAIQNFQSVGITTYQKI